MKSKFISILTVIPVIILFVWISFFPAPIQLKYHIVTKVFLGLSFLLLLARKRSSIFKQSDFPLWVFLGAIGINVLFAENKDVAARTYLDLAILMFIIYYLVSEGLVWGSKFKTLVKTICISSTLVAMGGILESLFRFNPYHEFFIVNPYYERYIRSLVVRPVSTQFNPAALGSYLLACLPFNFLLFREERSFFRFTGAAGVVLCMVVIVLSFSRGAFLGLIGMLILYFVAQKNYSKLLVLVVAVFVLVLICSNLGYPISRFGIHRLITNDTGILSSYRLNRWIMTQRMIRDFPLTGLGFKHFRIRFHEYYPDKHDVPDEFMIADNMYLTILTETGILGFLGFMIFLFSFFRRAWAQIRRPDFIAQKQLQPLMVLCALTGLLVNMGAYELFYWPNQYMLFCILVGLMQAFCRK